LFISNDIRISYFSISLYFTDSIGLTTQLSLRVFVPMFVDASLLVFTPSFVNKNGTTVTLRKRKVSKFESLQTPPKYMVFKIDYLNL